MTDLQKAQQQQQLFAIDVALVGKKAARQRWQFYHFSDGWVRKADHDPLWSSRIHYRRDPEAPALPSWDWYEAPDWARYRTVNGGSWVEAPSLSDEPRPPQAWFDFTANMTRDEYEALQRLTRSELVEPVSDESRVFVLDCDAPLREFFNDALLEANSAIEKFPQPNASMCALTEEVGELAKALMDEPSENVRKEAVQVACMAARVAVEGDPTIDPTREKRKAGIHPFIEVPDDGVDRNWHLRDEPADGGLSGPALHRAITDTMESGGGPRDFEIQTGKKGWRTVAGWPAIYLAMSRGDYVRRKPPKICHLIDANGVKHEWPEPMREPPEKGTRVWLARPDLKDVESIEWAGDPFDMRHLERGLVHATRERAVKLRDALLAASTPEKFL